jgi:hypothetical protein
VIPSEPRATVEEAIAAWEAKGPTSLTVALMADALYGVREETRTEWAIEVTWLDWKKAGAKGPTSQFGPFETEEQCDSFLVQYRRDRDIAATRVLTRRVAYTEWEGGEPIATTKEERDRLLKEWLREINPGAPS